MWPRCMVAFGWSWCAPSEGAHYGRSVETFGPNFFVETVENRFNLNVFRELWGNFYETLPMLKTTQGSIATRWSTMWAIRSSHCVLFRPFLRFSVMDSSLKFSVSNCLRTKITKCLRNPLYPYGVHGLVRIAILTPGERYLTRKPPGFYDKEINLQLEQKRPLYDVQ